MRKVRLSIVSLALALSIPAVRAESDGFVTEISGDVEATVAASGDLRCVGMGDMGPGYLDLRNGHRTDKLSFSMPIEVEAGTHEVTSWTRLAADGEVGQGFSVEVSMPLKRFHKAIDASGTLELTEVGTQPGERMRGSFDVTAESMGTTIRLEGTFDFVVGDGAREQC